MWGGGLAQSGECCKVAELLTDDPEHAARPASSAALFAAELLAAAGVVDVGRRSIAAAHQHSQRSSPRSQ